MSITDKELLDSILNIQEWQEFECKRAEVKPAKLLETVVAFANSEGGILVIGLDDPVKAKGQNRLIGISGSLNNLSEFFKLLEKEIDPSLKAWNKFELEITNTAGQMDILAVCRIRKSDDVHSLKNGDTFIRRGNQNVKIGSNEIIRLKYEKGVIKFEDEPSGVKELDEIDRQLFSDFRNNNKGSSPDEWQFFKDIGLALKRNGDYELTKSGVLLFAKNPSILLKGKYGIKVSHYYGNKSDYSGEANFLLRPFTIEGPLIRQVEEAVDYFRNAVKISPPKLKGAAFRPSLLIPEWAFQEAVTNAVIHRNYSLSDDIHIRFFDNRIEIESPGSYPGHITISNIQTERYARNPIILRTLNRFSGAPNLDIGEGVNRIFQVMAEHNLYEPLYLPPNLYPHSVFLTLFNMEKIGYWDTVNKYLEGNHRITNKQARKITGITDTLKMSRLFKNWTEEGLLEKIGGMDKKAVYYIRPGRDISNSLFSEALKIENKYL